jgi:hypothetical protein
VINKPETDSQETLLWLAIVDCCGGGGMLTIKESDKIVELLIKRGANVGIKFFEHPTLLQGVKNRIDLESQMDAENEEDKKKMSEMIKVRDLLTNASEIRAAYLKNQSEKEERKVKITAAFREQEKLKNIKADQIVTVRDKIFTFHTPILITRCKALLNF